MIARKVDKKAAGGARNSSLPRPRRLISGNLAIEWWPARQKIAADAGSCCDRPRHEVGSSPGFPIGSQEERAMRSDFWRCAEKKGKKCDQDGI